MYNITFAMKKSKASHYIMSMEKKTWGLPYYDQCIFSMSLLQTTYHNIHSVNGVKSPHLESHEVLEKEFESNPPVKPMHKAIRQYMHMLELCVHILEMNGLPIEHCISLL